MVGAASFGFATAQEGWRVPITNTGTGACSLPDYLSTVTAVGANGTRVTFSNGPLIQPASPITIPPEGKVTFLILSRAWCDSVGLILPSQHYGSIELALPTGTLELSNLSLKLCSSQIFSGFQEPVSALVPAPGSVASLIPHLEIPKTVKAGSLLHYQVVLENQSDKAIDLQPCPVYQEGITALGGPIQTSSQTLELNCTTVHLIKPHQEITYEMVIAVPSETGPAKFSWQIAPGGPYAGAGLTIGQ